MVFTVVVVVRRRQPASHVARERLSERKRLPNYPLTHSTTSDVCRRIFLDSVFCCPSLKTSPEGEVNFVKIVLGCAMHSTHAFGLLLHFWRARRDWSACSSQAWVIKSTSLASISVITTNHLTLTLTDSTCTETTSSIRHASKKMLVSWKPS